MNTETYRRGSREYVKSKNAKLAAMVQPQQFLMQVCSNGHKITEHFGSDRGQERDFCANCGAPTTTVCPSCETEMLGCKHYPRVVGGCKDLPVPEYCHACGKPYPWSKTEEDQFLAENFGVANVSKLVIDEDVKLVIQDRLNEAADGLKAKMPMSVIFSCGSAVEGMLHAYAMQNQELYRRATAAHRSAISEWHLETLINVAKEVGHIGEDTKQFAQPLKGFRNYIHPKEQVRANFKPTPRTAELCYQVAKSVVHDLEQVS